MARHDEKMARCGLCGRPVAECSDPDVDRFPQRSVCYESMALAEANRVYDEVHQDLWHDGTFKTWAPKRTPFTPYGPRDGVSLWLSAVDHSPDEDFLTRPDVGGLADAEQQAGEDYPGY